MDMSQQQGTSSAGQAQQVQQQQAAPSAAGPAGQAAAKPGKGVKPIHIVSIVLLAIASVGMAYWMLYGSVPTVKAGDNVSVYYIGTYTNGTIFDSNIGGQPLQFTVGSGQVITGFDNAVVGMRLNQERNITLAPDQAYGQVNQQYIMSVPISNFAGENVTVGMQVYGKSGSQQATGHVTAVNSTNVTIDFNPPLAGKTLDFSIRVVGIQGK